MKRLLGVLLVVAVVGCGGRSGQTKPSDGESTDQVATPGPIAALKALGASIKQNAQGEAVEATIRQSEWSSVKNTEDRGGRGYRLGDIDAAFVNLKCPPQLQMLKLRRTPTRGEDLRHLTRLKHLQLIDLCETMVTDSGLVYLKGLTKLHTRRLSSTPITDAGLAHLQGLTSLGTLYLFDTQVTDARLEHLKELSKLTYLDLTQTQITDSGIAELKQALPNCEITK